MSAVRRRSPTTQRSHVVVVVVVVAAVLLSTSLPVSHAERGCPDGEQAINSVAGQLVNRYENCIEPAPGVYVHWTVNERKARLDAGMSVEQLTTSWMALGVNTRDSMERGDSAVARWNAAHDGGDVVDYAMVPNGRFACTGAGVDVFGVCADAVRGATNNVDTVLLRRSDDETTMVMRFRRPLAAGDVDLDVTVANTSQYLLYAVGGADDIDVQRQHTTFGTVPMNFFRTPSNAACCASVPTPLPPGEPTPEPGAFQTCVDALALDDRSNVVALDARLTFAWRIVDVNGAPALHACTAFDGEGYVGIGWPSPDSPSSMVGSDAVLSQARTVAGTATLVVDDVQLVSQDGPSGVQRDAVQSIVAGSTRVAIVDGVRYASWQRLLDTGDSADRVLDARADVTTPMIFGYHTTSLSYQQHTERAVFSLCLNETTPCFDTTTDYREAHAWMMYSAWGVLLPIGMLIARFGKAWGQPWFIAHIVLQSAGMVVFVVAFALIIVYADDVGGEHFNHAHGALGLVVFILAALQPVLGLAAHFMWQPERDAAPIFPDKTHWLLGWSSALLAAVVIFLGIDRFFTDSSSTYWYWYLLWAIQLAVYIFVFAVLQKWLMDSKKK